MTLRELINSVEDGRYQSPVNLTPVFFYQSIITHQYVSYLSPWHDLVY